jgi:hypothetical protein
LHPLRPYSALLGRRGLLLLYSRKAFRLIGK